MNEIGNKKPKAITASAVRKEVNSYGAPKPSVSLKKGVEVKKKKKNNRAVVHAEL